MKKRDILLLLLFSLSMQSFPQQWNINWQQCFGGSEMEDVWDMIQIDDGYFIAGSTASNDGNISFNHGEGDAWLIKTDFEGEIIWEKTYGGSSGESMFRIFPTDNGHYYLLCNTSSSDGDISNDPYPESDNYWIVKIDSQGDIVWESILGGTMHEQLWTGTTTSDGGVVGYGWSGSPDGDVSAHYGGYDIWMVKLNSEGEKQWDYTIGTDQMDYGQAVIETSDGGFLAGGASVIGEGGNLTCEPFNWHAEAVLVKLDSNLNIQWQQCYGGSGHDGVLGLLELEDGYLVSAYGGSADGDLTGSGWHGSDDIWIIRIDFDGNIIWQKCYGGSRYEGAMNLFQNMDGGYTIIGDTRSNNGDVSGNHSISEHYSDIWVIRISSEGELLSQICIGGNGKETVYYGALKKSDYHYILATNTNYGPSHDILCEPHGTTTNYDYWVFEISDTTTFVPELPDGTAGFLKSYPNPASDYVCFERQGKESSRRMEINIFSASGLPVKELTLYPGETLKVWDTRSIPAGVYFYRSLRQDGTSEYGKVVIR